MSEDIDKFPDLTEGVLNQVLKFLTQDEILCLRPYLDFRVFDEGEIITNDGKTVDFIGFVLSGKLAVKKETKFPGRLTLVAILDTGAMVYETSMLNTGFRPANVVAMEKTEMLLLSCDRLEKILAERPELGIKLLKRIIHVLSLRLGSAYDRLSSLL